MSRVKTGHKREKKIKKRYTGGLELELFFIIIKNFNNFIVLLMNRSGVFPMPSQANGQTKISLIGCFNKQTIDRNWKGQNPHCVRIHT